MKEISEHVLIDTSLSGVCVGVLRYKKGVIFIDSPLSPKDIQSWRTIAMKTDCGPNRSQVLLDEHYDRTATPIPIKCPVITHEDTAKIIGSRPSTFRMPSSNTGGEWEQYPEIGPLHWIHPEITFTNDMKLEWEDDCLILEYHPGPAKGSIWVVAPSQKVMFIGDTVVVNEPPFFENANLEQWVEQLSLLKSSQYEDYTKVSGRSGIIENNDIQDQIKFLNSVKKKLERYASKKSSQDQIEKYALGLVENFPTKTIKQQEHYKARLLWGINQFYNRALRNPSE